MTRIGVIGAGYWGPNLIRNFAELDEAELVAVADKDTDRLARVLKRYPSVRGESDGAAILADDSIEAVVVVTPAETHHAIAKRALEAGKHVLVEKPLTMKADESR
ncbi:MAG: Gfo/Idh/MocA family oxidoreductase, partial [Gemmatimonadetes bacterium]|nr:Gfo/Idh/MocA family oxidoreductase [Gemmatimonadota bacterium]